MGDKLNLNLIKITLFFLKKYHLVLKNLKKIISFSYWISSIPIITKTYVDIVSGCYLTWQNNQSDSILWEVFFYFSVIYSRWSIISRNLRFKQKGPTYWLGL